MRGFEEMEKTLYWIWLSLRLGEGRNSFVKLIERFGSPRTIYEASDEELMTFKGEFGASLLERLSNKNLDEAYSIEEYCVRKRVKIIHYGAKDYPKPLTNLKNPPIILYARGCVERLEGKLCISVVGTRKMTEHGRDAAYRVGYELASAGAVVVSGLALGNDSAAAVGALDAGGLTVAVLGSGIDHVYPYEHKKIAAEIEARGVLMSEYPPTTGPTRASFPVRNRIISGMSQGTVVVEGPAGSGALITAKEALMQGRDVFAFPGNVDSDAAVGSNALIRDGARAVTCAADVLESYAYLYRKSIDMGALHRVSACSQFVSGKLLAHGVSEETYGAKKAEQKQKKLANLLHSQKKIDGESLRKISGENEYPIYDAEPPKEKLKEALNEKPKSEPDESMKALDSLPKDCREVFDAMPIGKPVSAEQMCNAGFEISKLMIAFTMLEVSGLISTLPGGLYCRR